MKPRRYSPSQYNLVSSFGWALSGIAHALVYERNLRIDFAVAAYVLYFSRYYQLDRTQYCVVLLFIGLVIACELLNTAIENTVDLETSVYNSLAKTAKDVAAGAVFMSAVASVAAGILLFWDSAVFQVIGEDIAQNLPLWIPLAALTAWWIVLPGWKRKYTPK